jgi:hypothetical protein
MAFVRVYGSSEIECLVEEGNNSTTFQVPLYEHSFYLARLFLKIS